MACYITIDSGTTNTRISIVNDFKVLDTLKFSVGARAGIEDKSVLKNTIKNGISEILSKNSMTENDITKILASGMITSEFGLCSLEHISTPAGIQELHDSMYETVLSEISQIPFVFVRGVKTSCENLETADMMRGEETELMGISQGGRCVYILPGSHSKIIYTDEKGRIINFSTMLTGEMIASLSHNTILKDAVSLKDTCIDKKYLIKGFEYCSQKGINEALFKVRVIKNMFGKNPDEVYSFFIGAVLCGEIKSVLSSKPERVIIGGKKQIKEAIAILLENNSEITVLSDETVDASSAIGMVKIFEWNC